MELWRTAALKAMELNPRLAEAYVLLGQSYFASPAWGCARHRDSELAERYFRKGLQIDPRFGLGHNALIYHLRWAGRPTEALQGAEERYPAAARSHGFAARARDDADAARSAG